LVPGDGNYLVPILDPLIVEGMTVNNGKFEVLVPHMEIRGLKHLNLESIR
jgi:hypothetical protein